MARIRVEIAAACRALGDADGATLALKAARGKFRALGARPALAALPTLENDAGLLCRREQ